jgi:hypothetical protein
VANRIFLGQVPKRIGLFLTFQWTGLLKAGPVVKLQHKIPCNPVTLCGDLRTYFLATVGKRMTCEVVDRNHAVHRNRLAVGVGMWWLSSRMCWMVPQGECIFLLRNCSAKFAGNTLS